MRPASQDTGLAVLVMVVRALRQRPNFSVKEKDETRLARVCGREPLNTFILALLEFEGFCFSDLRAPDPVFTSRNGNTVVNAATEVLTGKPSNSALVSRLKTLPRLAAEQ